MQCCIKCYDQNILHIDLGGHILEATQSCEKKEQNYEKMEL